MIVTPKRTTVLLDAKALKALSALRRLHEPIPSASDIVRQALLEKFARDVKRPNGGAKK